MSYERICIVDRKEYRYCGRCGRFIPREGGERFCSDNCKEVYAVCSAYKHGNITAEEAREKLNALDISNLEHFVQPLQENIYEILNKTNKEDAAKEDAEPTSFKKKKKKLDIVNEE